MASRDEKKQKLEDYLNDLFGYRGEDEKRWSKMPYADLVDLEEDLHDEERVEILIRNLLRQFQDPPQAAPAQQQLEQPAPQVRHHNGGMTRREVDRAQQPPLHPMPLPEPDRRGGGYIRRRASALPPAVQQAGEQVWQAPAQQQPAQQQLQQQAPAQQPQGQTQPPPQVPGKTALLQGLLSQVEGRPIVQLAQSAGFDLNQVGKGGNLRKLANMMGEDKKE